MVIEVDKKTAPQEADQKQLSDYALEHLRTAITSPPGSSALERTLQKPGAPEIDHSLIEQLKKKVDRLIRSDARQALLVAELAVSISRLSSDTAARALGARTKAMALHVLSRYEEAVQAYELARRLFREAGREGKATRVERAVVGRLG